MVSTRRCTTSFFTKRWNYLNENFIGRWIGRGSTIKWPARSPDLTPLDFFLWGHLKTVIYSEPVNNLEFLKTRIEEETANISENTLLNVINGFKNRVGFCLDQRGGIFENLL
jgi:hypothetical protein